MLAPRVAAAVLLVDQQGRVLLQLRDDKAPVAANMWGTVGGGVEPGEAPAAAAARELAEETGLRDVPLRPVWSADLPATGGGGVTTWHLFTADVALTDDDITVGEGADIRFVDRDRVLDLPMSTATRTVLRHFLEGSGPPAQVGLRDYAAWHDQYDDPASGLSWRLRTVRAAIAAALDDLPGPVRVVSSCAGDGRDLIGVLASRGDAGRTTVGLLEVDRGLCDRAERAAADAGLMIDVRCVDAGRSDAYTGLVPAHLVLLVGIFGNIDEIDVRRTIAAAPQLCAPGARLIWSRGRAVDDAGDRNDEIRAWFGAAGFTELGYHTFDAPDGSRPALGVVRYDGPPVPLAAGELWFTFVR